MNSARQIVEEESAREWLRRQGRKRGSFPRWRVEARVPCDLADYSETAISRIERAWTFEHSATGDVDCEVLANYSDGVLYLDMWLRGKRLTEDEARDEAANFWSTFLLVQTPSINHLCGEIEIDSAEPVALK